MGIFVKSTYFFRPIDKQHLAKSQTIMRENGYRAIIFILVQVSDTIQNTVT